MSEAKKVLLCMMIARNLQAKVKGTQTETIVYQEIQGPKHVPPLSQNAQTAAYFYMFFTPIFPNIIVTETNRYEQRQKHTNLS